MAAGHPVQPEPGEVRLPGGLGRGPGRQAADPAVPAHQHVQVAIHRDELEQPGRAQRGQQGIDIEGGRWSGLIWRDVQGPAADGGFQPQPLAVQHGGGEPAGVRLLHPGGDVAQGGELGPRAGVARGALRLEGDGAPALTPFEQQTRTAELRAHATAHGAELAQLAQRTAVRPASSSDRPARKRAWSKTKVA